MEQIISKNSILVKGVKKIPIAILINASISYNMNSPTRKKQIKSLTTNPKFQKMDEIKQQGVSVHSDDDVGEENHEIGN